MREVILRKSNSKGKKFDAIVDGKTVSFGAIGYEHYTDGLGYKGREERASCATRHLDKERRDNYEKRHRTIGEFKNIMTPSFWAYRLLWLKPTIREAIKDIEDKFNVKIKIEK